MFLLIHHVEVKRSIFIYIGTLKGVLHPWALFLKILCIFIKTKQNKKSTNEQKSTKTRTNKIRTLTKIVFFFFFFLKQKLEIGKPTASTLSIIRHVKNHLKNCVLFDSRTQFYIKGARVLFFLIYFSISFEESSLQRCKFRV